jgi:uncharacterized membrane protein
MAMDNIQPDRSRRMAYPFFVGWGGSLLMAALFTDYMYSQNSLVQWSNFSAWLITGGLMLALISAICLLIEALLGRTGHILWLDFSLLAAAAILSIFNVFIHSRDAWTSVVPTGITLSTIVTILLLIVGFRGWTVTAFKALRAGAPE